MVIETTFVETQEKQFQTLANSLPGAGVDWLSHQRREGMKNFQSLGIPTQRVEAWKYTNLNRLRNANYAANTNEYTGAPVALPQKATGDGLRMVFVNGDFRSDLSDVSELPAGLGIQSMEEALSADNGIERALALVSPGGLTFPSLNTAFMSNGYVVHVDPGTRLEMPLEILSVFDGADSTACHSRNLILLGEDSGLDLLERQIGLGDADYFTNIVTQVHLADGAKLAHFRHQGESKTATQIATLFVNLDGNADYDNFTLLTGSRLARNEIHVALNKPGAKTRLNGAYLIAGKQHCDTTTVIEHRAADTTSNETYKGVLTDNAQGVFAGRITVQRDAQRIKGDQLSRVLLLSDKAQINVKPELEIFADDVQCSHGATAGELAEDALFYLRSRGISEAEAQQMLITAFVAEIIDGIEIPAARDLAMSLAANWQNDVREGEEL